MTEPVKFLMVLVILVGVAFGQNDPILLDEEVMQDAGLATEFATTFALDHSCKGLVLLRYRGLDQHFIHPDAYWHFDIDQDNHIYSWRVIHSPDHVSYLKHSDKSLTRSVHSICSVVKGDGGKVK